MKLQTAHHIGPVSSRVYGQTAISNLFPRFTNEASINAKLTNTAPQYNYCKNERGGGGLLLLRLGSPHHQWSQKVYTIISVSWVYNNDGLHPRAEEGSVRIGSKKLFQSKLANLWGCLAPMSLQIRPHKETMWIPKVLHKVPSEKSAIVLLKQQCGTRMEVKSRDESADLAARVETSYLMQNNAIHDKFTVHNCNTS